MDNLNKFTLDVEAEKKAFNSILDNSFEKNKDTNVIKFDFIKFDNNYIEPNQEKINFESISTAFNSEIKLFQNDKLNVSDNFKPFENNFLNKTQEQTTQIPNQNFSSLFENANITNPNEFEKTNFNDVVSTAENTYREMNEGSSSQEKIYQTLNAMKNNFLHLNNKINQKSDIRANPEQLTQARETVAPKNLMFYDRLARASKKPNWA